MSVVLLGSTSGSVTLQEPAVAGSTVIDLPATSGTMAVLPTATSVLPQASGGTGTTTGYYGFKNRILNGGMVIDQRNAGASVAITISDNYITDRFFGIVAANSKLTGQQNAGSITPPVGFANYLGMTVAASANVTVGATDTYVVGQQIEGYNMADLAWGTASAATVTLSFWVRSSVTGTFGGSLRNSGATRSYPFTYTISAANTWEQKSVTIAGETSGTWLTTNGIGIRLLFGLGVGSTYSGTAGAWASANYVSATGATKLIETNSATFYITGVQLEKGSTATSFDYRPYGTELQLAQRYFQSYSFADASMIVVGATTSTGGGNAPFNLLVPMRTAPSTITIPAVGTSGGKWTPLNQAGGYPATLGNMVAAAPNPTGFRLNFDSFTSNYSGGGQAMWIYSAGASTMTVSAEL